MPCRCDIPKAGLTLSGGLLGSPPKTLTYHPAGTLFPYDSWFFGDTTFFAFYLVLRCVSGELDLANGDAANGLPEYSLTFISCTSSPFHAEFHDPSGVSGTCYVDG